MDSGAQMNIQLQQIYKTWEGASCDTSRGTRDLSCVCGDPDNSLGPIKAFGADLYFPSAVFWGWFICEHHFI